MGNIGLALGFPVTVNGTDYEVCGIDVDDYVSGGKTKCGGKQLKRLESELGPLPDTWISSARSDGTSGIRYVLVPTGLAFVGQAADDIEVVQRNHRYAVTWPSVHPDGGTYHLYPPGFAPDGVNFRDEIPDVTTLAVLPDSWLNHLTNHKTPDSEMDIDQVSTLDELDVWADEQFHAGDEASACSAMRETVAKWCEEIATEATSHDKIVGSLWEIVNLAAEGCTGWWWAIEAVETFWIEDVIARDKREAGELRREVWRSRKNAFRKVKAKVDQAAKSGTRGAQYTPKYCLHSSQMKTTGQPNMTGPQQNKAPVVSAAKFTDAGLAEVVARDVLIGRFLRIAGGNSWVQWDGMRWRNLGRDEGPVVEAVRQFNMWQLADAAEALANSPGDTALLELVKAWKAANSAARITAVLKLARNLVSVDVSAIDADPYMLNTPNGTYDLHNCEFAPHSAENRLTRITQGTYYELGEDSESNVPRYGVRWARFLERIMPNVETRRYLQKAMGMALVGRIKEKNLFIFNGSGDNGKNVFWEAMFFALGDSQTGGYAVVSRADLLEADGKDRQLLEMGLKNARVAFISETNKQVALAEGIVKKLTGDKLNTARTHYQEPETFVQSATVVLVTNKLPTFTGDDVAMRKRLRVVPFSVEIPEHEQDNSLGEALELEADAVLTWLIDGYCDYLENGLDEPEEIVSASNRYHLDNNIIERAIHATCVDEPDAKSDKKQVLAAVSAWLKVSGSPSGGASVNPSAIRTALERRGNVTTRSNGGTWLRGIRLKTDQERIAEESEGK